ncbi:hypothetical protein CEP54_012689 [Fusarium duplospermum]|uniref:Uncharacterized protein n=1 Tax=Fusarium duplospermum TaxID=1325734 RepID=A0A428P7D6_9HYPO|nr:hypothetical protein CEP54_012689 [Fusarium duplospermum]
MKFSSLVSLAFLPFTFASVIQPRQNELWTRIDVDKNTVLSTKVPETQFVKAGAKEIKVTLQPEGYLDVGAYLNPDGAYVFDVKALETPEEGLKFTLIFQENARGSYHLKNEAGEWYEAGAAATYSHQALFLLRHLQEIVITLNPI